MHGGCYERRSMLRKEQSSGRTSWVCPRVERKSSGRGMECALMGQGRSVFVCFFLKRFMKLVDISRGIVSSNEDDGNVSLMCYCCTTLWCGK